MEKQMDFESALARLEKLVDEMERENLPLDDLLARYKEGMDLLRTCRAQLDAAQETIEKQMTEAE